MPNYIFHKAEERGSADHGWLKANHSFSFANYYNPQKMSFGLLRVLNDDTVAPGMGFGMHPHENMEIITIPTEGALEHKDSMGNTGVIKSGDVQVMSAGSGVYHSEFNASKTDLVKLFQIWIITNKHNASPRYDQQTFHFTQNELQVVVSPLPAAQGLGIYQNAWISKGIFDRDTVFEYKLNDTNNGVYAFVINGSFEIDSNILNKRDALGVSNANSVSIKSLDQDSQLLILEVPMH